MVIEFAGLPRSGKTSCVDTVRDYFNRKSKSLAPDKQINVIAHGEYARACPFGASHRIELAAWIAHHALDAVLEANAANGKRSLVLQDRGLFDALAFVQLLYLERVPSFSAADLDSFMTYFANPHWVRCVDHVVLFRIEPEIVLERDVARAIDKRRATTIMDGTITNLVTLHSLDNAYTIVRDNYWNAHRVTELRVDRSTTQEEKALSVIELIEGKLANASQSNYR